MSTENQNPEESVPNTMPLDTSVTATVTKPAYPPVPITEWIITFFLLAIPLLNIILLFIWAFGSDTNPSKANFAKAYLIIFVIMFALTALFFMLFGTAIWGYVQSQSGGYF